MNNETMDEHLFKKEKEKRLSSYDKEEGSSKYKQLSSYCATRTTAKHCGK